jgi:hypothetical protein
MMEITSSRTSVFRSNVSQFSSFYETRKVFLQILVILTLAAFPVKAFSQCNASGDITFDVSNSNTFDWGVICDGPFFRTSGEFTVPSGTEDCTFYAAKETIFSVDGMWTCKLFDPVSDEPITEREFCMFYLDEPCGISLKISGSDALQFMVDGGYCFYQTPCNRVSVSSFLGDNTKQEKSKQDIDVFTFDGTAGDQVTLRLETDPKEGNNGGEASLGISGNSLNESTSGKPPLELEVTLPGDGEYSITVGQPRNSALRFRGSYVLSVILAIGSIDLIEPTTSVEK